MSRRSDSRWNEQFGIKFDFSPLPWGMAVAKAGANELARFLSFLSIAFHANGVFEAMAGEHRLDISFLAEQRSSGANGLCRGASSLMVYQIHPV